MKFGISAWRLNGPNYGVARYTQYLIRNWKRFLNEEDEITLFLHSPIPVDTLFVDINIKQKIISPKMTNALWENILLPRYLRDIDVLFSPSYTLPLLHKGKSVVSIHSLNEAEAGTK